MSRDDEKPRIRVDMEGKVILPPAEPVDLTNLSANAEAPASPGGSNAYKKTKNIILMEMVFKCFSFGVAWLVALVFFIYTIYLMCSMIGCIMRDDCIDEMSSKALMPYLAGFVLLSASLGLSISFALLRYSFPPDQRGAESKSSIPLTPVAQLVVDCIEGVADYFKKKFKG